jgi:hypothetical protein
MDVVNQLITKQSRIISAYLYNHLHFLLSLITEGIPKSLSGLLNGEENHIILSLMPDFNSALTTTAILLKHFGMIYN